MRWLLLGTLLADSRVTWLLIFVIAALIVAIFLIRFDFHHRHKTKVNEVLLVENNKLTRFKKAFSLSKDNEEKLKVINLHSKALFRDKFHLTKKHSFSNLVDFFTQHKKEKFANFCKDMLKVYYSETGISDSQINLLANTLIVLIKETSDIHELIKEDVKKKLEKEEKKDDETKAKVTKELLKEVQEKSEKKGLFGIFNKKERVDIEKIEEKDKTVLSKSKNINLKEIKKLERDIIKQKKEKEKLNSVLEKQKQQKQIIEERLKKEQIVKEKEVVEEKEEEKKWFEEVEDKPKIGKEWLKEFKKKKRDGLIK